MHTFLLYKLWHMAKNVTRSVPMEMLWFLRQAKAFRVLVSTLQRQAQEGGRGSHSYCCEKINNVSSARAAPIQRYGVTCGQLACGLVGDYGDVKPAPLAGYSSKPWINTYKNFMNGVAIYTQKQMTFHAQWRVGFIALCGGWRQKCVSFHQCEL